MRTALIDARLSDPAFRRELQRRAQEAGWAEIGGKLIRDMTGKPVARTRWLPCAEWYQRMQRDPQARIPGDQPAVAKAVTLALKGEPMTPQQRRSVGWMLTDHETYALWLEEEQRGAREQIAA